MTKRNLQIPKSLRNPQKWKLDRRAFLRWMMAGAITAQLPWWAACTPDKEHQKDYILSEKQRGILTEVQSFLFPSDGNGPGATELQAVNYLQWVLFDPYMDPEEKNYVMKGIAWVEETAIAEMDSSFLKLSKEMQTDLLETIANEDWGESWLSINITFIFEALLSDPIYGSNMNAASWKWLDHNPGHPRPNEEMKYGNFLHYIHQKNQVQ